MYEDIWETEESHAFSNPRLSQIELGDLKEKFPAHIFLTTSGTTSLKWVALSKKAFLASAEAVNRHIDTSLKDIWINSLPYFHVGGLSIYARAYLGKTFVYRYDNKWNPLEWAAFTEDKRGTLTSLVPTQLWDLLQQNIKPPKWLRALFIGGQKLSSDLYDEAKGKGWPILPTYGMTELCSQIATAPFNLFRFNSSEMILLPHIEAKVAPDGRLSLKSPALLTGYLTPDFVDPKINGWFETDDLVALNGRTLTPLGRVNDVIKISGELVNLYQLERHLDELKRRLNLSIETALIPQPDERAGFRLHLYHTPYDVRPLIESFNASVAPFSRISQTIELPTLPKTPLGKIAKTSLFP